MTTDLRPLILLAVIPAAFGLQLAVGCVREPNGKLAPIPAVAADVETATGLLCDDFLPLATAALPPPFSTILGPLDVLVCDGAKAAVTAALSSAKPPAADGGAPVMASRVYAHRVLRQNGKAVALARGPAWLLEQTQAALAAAEKDGGAR